MPRTTNVTVETLGRVFYGKRPRIVCLCGSTRFRAEFHRVNRELTMRGDIVLSPGVFVHVEPTITPDQKRDLDALHRRKIELADVVLVLDINGYIGESTRAEIGYAKKIRRPVLYLSREAL